MPDDVTFSSIPQPLVRQFIWEQKSSFPPYFFDLVSGENVFARYEVERMVQNAKIYLQNTMYLLQWKTKWLFGASQCLLKDARTSQVLAVMFKKRRQLRMNLTSGSTYKLARQRKMFRRPDYEIVNNKGERIISAKCELKWAPLPNLRVHMTVFHESENVHDLMFLFIFLANTAISDNMFHE